MNISPSEIDSIDEIGTLDGNPLRMIRLIGGFYVCTGRSKGKLKEEVLSAGSHPAIVRYNVEKQYPGVQISMMKSETMSDGSLVDKHSHFLTEDLRKSGHDIYSVQNGNEIDFYVTKQNVSIANFAGSIEEDKIVINKMEFPKEFSKALAGATVEKAISCNAKKLRLAR